MELKLNRKGIIPASVLTAILLTITILDGKTFFAKHFKYDVLLYISCFALIMLIGAILIFDIKIKNKTAADAASLSLFLLTPLISITMTECLNGIFIYDMTYIGFWGNYFIVFGLYILIYALSGSLRLPVILLNSILFLLATTHFYVKEFRGSPFLPMDFMALETGANVAGQYSFKLNYPVLIAALLLVLLIVIGVKLHTPKITKIRKFIARGICGISILTILILFYLTNFFSEQFGLMPDFWNQSRGYKQYGFVCSFFVNTKYLYVTSPADYDSEAVEGYMDSVLAENEEVLPNKKPNGQTPNIICIMNESLSDLSVLGDFKTNIDYMPFMRSLKENTIRGNLYVPVIGGGTSNSEYEFLTGNTTAFFPGGSNAYMLYVKDKAPSLVSSLTTCGYENYAFHPYYSSGWNRVNVYESFGFSQFKSLGNIIDMSIISEYQKTNNAKKFQEMVSEAYPNSDILLRTYVSDSYDYKVLIEDYENRDTSQPYHVFNVTMQNHGPYNKTYDNFEQEVFVEGLSREYPLTNQYLSLVKRSDDALRELLEYFSNVDEPVIICMFGDHQPNIEDAFVEEVIGKPIDSLTTLEEQKRRTTQFYIWANYDIEEQEIERMSVNYLSSLLLKTAGLPLTKYNQYLLTLRKELPVIDTVGYIDDNGNYYTWYEQTEYSELLNQYKCIQHNNVFDKKNKKEHLFYLQ